MSDEQFVKDAEVRIKSLDNRRGTIVSVNRGERMARVRFQFTFDPKRGLIGTVARFSFDVLSSRTTRKRKGQTMSDEQFVKDAQVRIKSLNNRRGTIVSVNRGERMARVRFAFSFDPQADPIETVARFSFDDLTVV